MTQTRIGFFGLGTMGGGMVHRLLGAGFEVRVFTRTAGKEGAFVAAGATSAGTAREAAAGADVLIAMVADDEASKAVWMGEDGALAGAKREARPGAICVDCSTLSVGWVKMLAADAHAHGCRFIDAPVTGTKPHAAAGELTFLAGGAAEDIEAVRGVLAVMSKEIVHVGPVGSGAAVKLINNFVCGVQAAALGEGVAMIEAMGLDEAKALPVLLNGVPGSPLVKTLAGRYAKRDFTANFKLKLMAKDIRYALEEARKRGMKLATAEGALKDFERAIAAGKGDEDMSAVIQFLLGAKG